MTARIFLITIILRRVLLSRKIYFSRKITSRVNLSSKKITCFFRKKAGTATSADVRK